MAGYIFSLDSVKALENYAMNGLYATKLSKPKNRWQQHHEGTFADYVTMKEGDNVYFFIKRKIYGIGKMINVNQDCKYFNYPEAGIPVPFHYEEMKDRLLWDEGEYSIDQRFICLFAPDPYFFKNGVDMDDVLSSNPRAFKMLRAFWKLSFIKFDDEENQAFRDVLIKHNQPVLKNPASQNIFATDYNRNHSIIKDKTIGLDYNIKLDKILSTCANDNGLAHEMALEVAILSQLANNDPHTVSILGKWDYLSHQVIASPFKPIDYMDKIDIFGYSYIEGHKPTKSKYLIIELKKDTAHSENLDQIMKYVDWVTNEYCFGDYSMIKSFIIAYDFDDQIKTNKPTLGNRKYTTGMKPAKSMSWNDLTLVSYKYIADLNKIELEVID